MVGLSEKQGTGRESDVDSDGAADGGRHFAHFGHQLAELLEGELLLVVRDGLGRVGVDFDQQTVGTAGDRSQAVRDNQVGASGRMRRVVDDRQAGLLLEQRDRVEVRLRPGFDAANRENATQTQDDARIAAGDVFGCEQEFVE